MTLLIFIIVLGVLVFVHELGHFIVARRAGARIEEFGIGFPPRLASWRRGETLYSLNLIPLGGFVKIFGEDEAEVKSPRSFGGLPVRKRAGVLVAGVLMNVILAWFLFSLVAAVGQPTLVTEGNEANAGDVSVRILQVERDTPAAAAGLKAGDELTEFESVEAFQEFVKSNAGREVTIAVGREGKLSTVNIMPRANPPSGEGALGVYLGKTGIVSSPLWRAPWDGLKTTLAMIAAIVFFVARLLASIVTGGAGELLSSLAGPVGIASLTGEAARLGFAYLLQFTAVLSVNLAVINILPLPALDGGRLVFLAIEKIRGRPASKSIEHAVNMAGFIFLIFLAILITFQDITRFIL